MAVKRPPTDTMEGMNPIGDNVYLYTPPTTAPSTTHQEQTPHAPPSMVILCTWLGGATPRRIQKYVQKHQTLFPTTTILVIRSTIPEMTLHSFQRIRARLAPARTAISTTASSNPDSKMLLHVFSTGGANVALQLAVSMQESNLSFPLGGLILDCSPGTQDFKRAYDAAAHSIPKGWVYQTLGRAALYPFLATVLGLQDWGLVPGIREMRWRLNDERVLGREVRRLYLYGLQDAAVTPEDVEPHVEEAREAGFDVATAKFEDAPHCAILLRWPERYGEAILRWWEGGKQDEVREAELLKSKL